ncbi:HutD family protein [Clostridium sp. 19966]|uniref:HutD/Ves family protein n=1 Tax=Clostridium sp. 19966 TaxID=2768166 RepID=UPI0028DE9A9A|nr:HutD family protein [Clostridium sp. 19966]MDT8718836.1 HutD family protein [Clostridium sp. 19966]
MNINKITQDKFKTTEWLGGKTTELFIWPENGSYQKRQFDFRLSTATIEIEESDFTKLPGIHRILMPLQGNIALCFNGEETVNLKPYDFADFEGDWNTTSKGVGRDFNLMLAKDWTGSLKHLPLSASNITEADAFRMKIIYSAEGEALISVENKEFILQQGEILYLESEEKDGEISIKLSSKTEADLVVCNVFRKIK